jgi:hypothetical protein
VKTTNGTLQTPSAGVPTTQPVLPPRLKKKIVLTLRLLGILALVRTDDLGRAVAVAH